ncbi:MAG: RagB/SusD family nutrient uptake outer membrane protein [Butyricimonas paravirosa]
MEITDAQLLLDFCPLERRKELSGETNHRWFDLKRFGMTELTHSFFGDPTETKSEYKLEKEGYLLPIPEEAIRLNTDLEQNKRKVSK